MHRYQVTIKTSVIVQGDDRTEAKKNAKEALLAIISQTDDLSTIGDIQINHI